MNPLKNNRARQFLPFNGLRGFTEQLKKQEEHFEEELPLTDDEAEFLNHIVPRLTRGSLIHIRYYHLNQYKHSILYEYSRKLCYAQYAFLHFLYKYILF